MKMGKRGEGSLRNVCVPPVAEEIQINPGLIFSLENCASIECIRTFVTEQEEVYDPIDFGLRDS